MAAAGRRGLWLAASALAGAAVLGQAAGAAGTATAPPGWEAVGPMVSGRAFFTLTTIEPAGGALRCGLVCGRVLAAGGQAHGSGGPTPYTATAELHDPVSGSWAPTGPMLTARFIAAAVQLGTGEVLVAGGLGNVTVGSRGPTSYPVLASAELYSPVAGAWRPTGSLGTARYGHTLTLLDGAPCSAARAPAWCGDALAVGGQDTDIGGPLTGASQAEQFDHRSGSWTVAGQPAVRRWGHTATALQDGRVLVAGGEGPSSTHLRSAEIYDPDTRTWRQTGQMSKARMGAVAARLPDGRVLVAGGSGPSSDSAELFDPATGTWADAGKMTRPLYGLLGGGMPSGQVLVLGSDGGPGPTLHAELYDPATRRWRGEDTSVATSYGAVAMLPEACGPSDRSALFAGGFASNGMASAAAWRYGATPRVGALAPATGPVSGGTPVVISGANLAGVTGVFFGGVAAVGFTVDGDRQITATSPPQGQPGPVAVTVVSSVGSSAQCASDTFTYTQSAAGTGHPLRVAAINPACGSPAGTTPVMLTGEGFVPGQTRVWFGSVRAAPAGPGTARSVTVLAPPAPAPSRVLVTVDTPVVAAAGPSFLYSNSCTGGGTGTGTNRTAALTGANGGTAGGFQIGLSGPGSGGLLVPGGAPPPVPPGTAVSSVQVSAPVGLMPMNAPIGMPSGGMLLHPREDREPETAAEGVHLMASLTRMPAAAPAAALVVGVGCLLEASGRRRPARAAARPRTA